MNNAFKNQFGALFCMHACSQRGEQWFKNLWQVEAAMKLAVKVTLLRCFEESKTPKKDKWVKEFPGQCGIRSATELGFN